METVLSENESKEVFLDKPATKKSSGKEKRTSVLAENSGEVIEARAFGIDTTSYDYFSTDEGLYEKLLYLKDSERVSDEINFCDYILRISFAGYLFKFVINNKNKLKEFEYSREAYLYINQYFGSDKELSGDKKINFIAEARKQIDYVIFRTCYQIPKLKEQLTNKRLAEIYLELKQISCSFVRLGIKLMEFKRDNLYDTSQDFFEYIEGLFGFKKSSVNELIRICERFCVREKNNLIPELKETFTEYNQSQLAELVSLTDAEIKEFNPQMTVKEIREKKQEIKKNLVKNIDRFEDSSDPINIAPQEYVEVEAAEIKKSDFLMFKNDTERLEWLEKYKDNCYLWAKINPLGFDVYRFDFMNKVSLLVCEFGKNNFNYQIINNGADKPAYPVSGKFSFSTMSANQVAVWLKENRNYI